MSNRKIDLLGMQLDFEASQAETIALETTHIDRALQLCSPIQNEDRQWQTYLNALALFGFVQWLLHRAPDISVNSEDCSIFQPQHDNRINAVCDLKVGEFKLCLTAMGSLTVEEIAMPVAAIDSPKSIPHFYVVVEVEEELEQATIQGFVRYEHLVDRLRSANLQAASDGTYQLPLSWFEKDVDLLLLYLRCLEPAAMPLPTTENVSQTSPVADMVQLLTQPVLNVGLWLRDEIDEVAQGLSWVLLPAFAPAAAMRPLRSPTQELEAILTEVQRMGTQVPAGARGAYQDLQLHPPSPPLSKGGLGGVPRTSGGLGGVRVRLYAVTWPLLSPQNVPEWKLLLVLGAPPGYNNLPYGTMMRVSDETNVLVERVLNRDSAYIYACVAGTWDETFLVTIALANGTTLTLPPFAFRPE